MTRTFTITVEQARAIVAAIQQGAPGVVGFDPKGQRQMDFRHGWNAAQERAWRAVYEAGLWNAMTTDECEVHS